MYAEIVQTVNAEKKPIKSGNKTHYQHFCFFAKICTKFVTFLRFFSFVAQKMLKIKILTSVWGAQHPNAGLNIQQGPVVTNLIHLFVIHFEPLRTGQPP